ncbi:MAG: hypothetical protein ACLQLC_15835 [Candidatus Sulfotelmatobacter sp.]
MKKAIMVAVLAVAAVCAAQAEDITGDWQGTLPMGMGEIRIVLHITKAPDGSLKATLDSPDQAVVGMPVDSISLEGSKLKFTASVVKGSYEGNVKNATTITGNWSQPKRLQLDFKKSTSPIKLTHPPAPPSDIDGTWEGEASLPSLQNTPSNGKLRLTFHVKNTGDGLTATFDEPDMNIKGWPVVAVIRKGSSIKIEAPQVGGSVSGKLNKDLTVISGDWFNGEHTYAITLRRSKDAPTAAQPATPPPASH